MRPVQPPLTGAPIPSIAGLFAGFFWVGMCGFGGVLPFAHQMTVERKRWLTEEEFIDSIAMSQLLPGPNVVNFSSALGGRFQGPLGALAGILGMVAAPFVLVLSVVTLLNQVISNPTVLGALHGMAVVAAGFVLATAIKMIRPMLRKRDLWSLGIAACAFAGAAVLQLPLIWCLLALGPLSIALVRWRRLRA